MDAVKFVKEYLRMCGKFSGCEECPAFMTDFCTVNVEEQSQETAGEVVRVVEEWSAETLRQLCRGCDLDRLEKLAEADKDGRCVVLPCKVGTATYYIHYPIAVYPDKSEPEIKRGIFTLCDLDRVGRSVFLTREEAEKALEAMKDG